MKLKQWRYHGDNLGYLVYGAKEALAIDAGAVQEILTFLEERGLALKWVLNTHMHPDHTTGNPLLLEMTGAAFLDTAALLKQKTIDLEGEKLLIHHTPGHTHDSLVFELEGALITGDTLFNGTVGNCFSGDLEAFFHSIRWILGHPPTTLIYAGHDYVKASMAFARILEPENPAIDAFLARYTPDPVYSTLADELTVNPYLRFNDPKMIRLLEEKRLPARTEYERWESIMTLG